MQHTSLLLTTAILLATSANAQTPRPVLVELFTSEGCSSCPPADALLINLDKSQPVPGAEVVVLSEHVDYWDHDGWRDQFSSPEFTKRQQGYASHFHLDQVYTPQIVVDGAAQVLGSDKAAAVQAVSQAEQAQKLDMSLTLLPDAHAQLQIDPLPPSFKGQASVFLAMADSEDTTAVRAGENKGRELHHVAVVRSLTEIGKVSAKAGFTKELPLSEHSGKTRLIAFVQESKQGRILGTAMLTDKANDSSR